MLDKNYTLKMGVDVSELRQAKKEISSSLKEISAGIKYATGFNLGQIWSILKLKRRQEVKSKKPTQKKKLTRAEVLIIIQTLIALISFLHQVLTNCN